MSWSTESRNGPKSSSGPRYPSGIPEAGAGVNHRTMRRRTFVRQPGRRSLLWGSERIALPLSSMFFSKKDRDLSFDETDLSTAEGGGGERERYGFLYAQDFSSIVSDFCSTYDDDDDEVVIRSCGDRER